jgi:hypothetical protein
MTALLHPHIHLHRPGSPRSRGWQKLAIGLTRAPDRRCAMCGTLVRDDDAIGIVNQELAHAECALMHWLHCSPENIDLLIRRLAHESPETPIHGRQGGGFKTAQ